MVNQYYKGKKIWITGASSGIGEAMALALAELGAHLIVSGRKADLLQQFCHTLEGKGAPSATSLAFDLGSEEERKRAILEVQKAWTAPDVLLLSGGLSQRSLIIDTETAVYRQLMEVDYLANVDLSRTFIPAWGKKPGQVVIISSLVGKIPTPYRSGYAAAKHALHGYFESMASEHPEIKVNIVCPGFIHTQVSVNALTGDGSPLDVMDQAQENGMPAPVFARKALKAIERNKAVALIGGKEVWGVHLFRFFPGLFRKIIGRAKVR